MRAEIPAIIPGTKAAPAASIRMYAKLTAPPKRGFPLLRRRYFMPILLLLIGLLLPALLACADGNDMEPAAERPAAAIPTKSPPATVAPAAVAPAAPVATAAPPPVVPTVPAATAALPATPPPDFDPPPAIPNPPPATPAPDFALPPETPPRPTPLLSAAALVETDRAALVALYNATNGPEWSGNRYWLTDLPISAWQGVDTDESGRVPN